MSKDLYSLNTELLSTPATHFEVMESLYCLSEANELISSYKFKEASKILENALKMYNKYRQKKIIVLILLQLRKIASTLNQDSLAINHLQTALEISKSGDIPLEYVLRIQYQLGKIYFKLGDYNNSLNHFKVLIQFLANEKESIERDNYLGTSFLYMGLIYQELNDVSNSKVNFKNAFHIGSTKSQKVLLKYHLLRAKQYKKKGNLSQTHILLKKAFESLKSFDEKHISILIELFLELAEFYVHHRKDTKKAFYFLDTIKPYLSKKNLLGIKKTLRWNLLMSDYYKFLVKSEEYKAFFTQSENLRNQLRAIGISE
jgi:tetratricopeptide (TPR) repeat protein